ncbi:serine/threonine protein kinase [Stieleria sp. ICT_E10.1]|uniref:serine/threonine-protein kinase n=1 Tax=Stieleria sedimenti TaxID=2976331 RepID=UPI0021800EEB|nr:serine/threonine-protein kinase [Stieleria sedimenti]MCS7468316.1 serine/threonine protein kinase [Stieleria sedimenti]
MPAFHYQRGDRPLEGYTIGHALGRGGFGEVYFATSDAGREVALKAVQNYEDIELRGIGHCMNLKSPHLVMIFDVKQGIDGTPWVIMEFVAGPSLREILDASPEGIAPEQALFFVRELARGIDYLHDAGIVHRDLKPHNIFFEDGIVKIGDYSLSKVITVSHASGHTMTVGSVHYMAPEISMGRYDKTVDLYALGVMLFEMLTGEPPFVGESVGEILMKHLTGEVDVSGLQEPFAGVVRKAMDRDPVKRFQSAREMAAALGCDTKHVTDDSIPASLSLVGRKPAASSRQTPPQIASIGVADLADTVGAKHAIIDTAESEKTSDESDNHDLFAARLRRMADVRYLARVGLSIGSTVLLMTVAFAATAYGSGIFGASTAVLMALGIWLISMMLAITLVLVVPQKPGISTALVSRTWLIGIWLVAYFFIANFLNNSPQYDVYVGCWLGGFAATMLIDWRCFCDPHRAQRVAISRTLIAGAISGVVAGLSGWALGMHLANLDNVILSMAATMTAAITVQLTSVWVPPEPFSLNRYDATGTDASVNGSAPPVHSMDPSTSATPPTAERVSW